METHEHECEHKRGYDISQIEFCQALETFYDEHIPLKEKMAEWNEMILNVQNDESIQDYNKAIQAIYDKLVIFLNEFNPHAKKEELVLIPLMANHLGYENKTLMVMEFEHGLAKENLENFINGAKQLDQPITQSEAFSLLTSLNIAYITLNNHFLKEEGVLYPMAEELLTVNEKEELLRRIEIL